MLDPLRVLGRAPKRAEALVLCLGDLGRSPRICHQALALCATGRYDIHLLGYLTTPLFPWLTKEPALRTHALADGALFDPFSRQIVRALSLISFLITHPNLTLLMVQNPPTAPILWVLLVYRWIRRLVFGVKCEVVVDCHNYGWTIAACGGWPRWLCRALEKLEVWQLGEADAVLTVSRAMRDDLRRRFGVASAPRLRIWYDKPTAGAKPPAKARAEKALREYVPLAEANAFRVVTATSYTADEAIDWVVRAVGRLSRHAVSAQRRVELVITGKGAGAAKLGAIAKEETLQSGADRLLVAQVFVSHDDYLPILAAAHVGVCLHRSSSGLDLPMKVTDMHAAGLKNILAYDYPTLREILPRRACFTDEEDLLKRLIELMVEGGDGGGLEEDEVAGEYVGQGGSVVQCLW